MAPTLWRIRDRGTFAAMRRSGRRARRGLVTVTWLAPADAAGDPPRIAFAVPGRSGAVVRNRVRRRLRAALAAAGPLHGRVPRVRRRRGGHGSLGPAPSRPRGRRHRRHGSRPDARRPSPGPAPVSPAARVAIAPVKLYRLLRVGKPSPCRFEPSCSTYALEAIEGHGAARGSWLAARRLARCHPWGGHGWDPVPEPPTHRLPADKKA